MISIAMVQYNLLTIFVNKIKIKIKNYTMGFKNLYYGHVTPQALLTACLVLLLAMGSYSSCNSI